MRERTLKNGAPAWELTEIAVAKGKELARKYAVNEELVVVALYLAHIVFSKKIGGRVQKRHEELSARLADKYLKSWKVGSVKREIILNAILAHHEKVPPQNKVAEVMKNAECFKFITVPGALILLHDLGTRHLTFAEAVEQAKYKARQKLGYISLKRLKKEAEKNYRETMRVLDLFRIK